MSSRIALLIDAENISYRDLPELRNVIKPHGEIVLQAVYGDWGRPDMQNWHKIALQQGFKIRHQTNASEIKNAADMKLIMDAMEVLIHVPVDIFCLATNDADYMPLCDKIHESRKYVIGIGYPHASEVLIRACDQFIFVGRERMGGSTPIIPAIPVSNALPDVAVKPTPVSSELKNVITDAFNAVLKNDVRWVSLSVLGSTLRQVKAGFRPNDYGHANLTKFLKHMSDTVELQSNGSVRYARLRSNITAEDERQKLVVRAFEMIEEAEQPWINLSTLGTALRQVKVDFNVTHYGFSTLSELLDSMPDFVEIQTNGSVKSARLRK